MRRQYAMNGKVVAIVMITHHTYRYVLSNLVLQTYNFMQVNWGLGLEQEGQTSFPGIRLGIVDRS